MASDQLLEFPTEILDKINISVIPEITELLKNNAGVLGFLRSRGCLVIEEQKISDFLAQYPGLEECLWGAYDNVFKYFRDVKIELELFFDPEIKDDKGELFLRVITKDNPEEAQKKLDRLNKEWLFPIIKKERIYNLNTDIEFE